MWLKNALSVIKHANVKEEEKMVSDLLEDEKLTKEELEAKYGPIPEEVPNEPIEYTIEEAMDNGIETELEVDADETSDENIPEE